MKKTFGLLLLFVGLLVGKLYANDTIRWTWKISYDRICSFRMSGTEGGEFLVDWGDGTTEVITGEDSWYGSYIEHKYIKGNYAVRLYALRTETAITYLSATYSSMTSLDVSACPSLVSLSCRDNRLTELDVTKNPALTYLDCRNNRLTFSILAQMSVNGDLYMFPQNWCYDTIEIHTGLPMPELPVVKGTQAHLDVWKGKELLSANRGYTIYDDSVYFEKTGCYKLVVWHDSVREHYETYGEMVRELYSDTTFVTVYIDYESGNEVAYWTWKKENSRYYTNIAFAGTEGESFIIDWGDGQRTVSEGTGDLVRYTHTYNMEDSIVRWRLYATTSTAHILKLQKDYESVLDEKLDVSACPELRYLQWNGRYYEDEDGGLTMLDVSKNVKLEHLECMENRLTSLDVSKNVNLKYLDLEDNRLTILDISKNVDLEYLNCGDNPLSMLDVSKNVGLKHLNCDWNRLTSLDLSKNVNLKYLDCSANRLASLDLSKNVNLEYLDCETNQLISLDVTKNVNLEHLDCGNNQLPLLDVTKNVNLEHLNCGGNPLYVLDISDNLNLKSLYCHANRLDSLDVTKNVNLEYLDCSKNQLYGLDVSGNLDLKTLYCESNRLDSLDVSKNVNLKDLLCSDNYLTSLDVSRNIELSYLECAGNRLTVLDVSRNENLHSLYCAGNRLTNLDLSAQKRLYWGENRMGFEDNFREVVLDESRSYEMSAFPGMNVDSILSVRGGHLEGTRMIFDADEVEYLYATGYQGRYDYGTRPYDTVWFRLVSDNHSEPQIPLTAEFFPDDIFRAYVAMFDKDGNDSLCEHECAAVKRIYIGGASEIILYWNRGVKSLDGLQYFENLEDLICNANELTSLDISHNLKLVEIYCTHNRLTSLVVSDKPALKWLSCDNNTLTTLDVKNCPILEDVACFNNCIERMDISNCPSVEGLNYSNNRLQKLDVSGFPALRSLYCMGNNLSDLDVSADLQLESLGVSFNSLPLSRIAALRTVWSNTTEYGVLVLSPQRIAVSLSVDEVLDLSSELNDAETVVDFGNISANVYTFVDGRLKFNKKGKYEICLSNGSMLSKRYVLNEWLGYEDWYEEGGVEVYYDITVKAEGGNDPDDPDDPDTPDNPDNPTANEDGSSSGVNVYVRNHIIYLSENLGEMRVFTVMGQCIHRGNGPSAEVPCAGLYIVQAGGRVWKVVVK